MSIQIKNDKAVFDNGDLLHLAKTVKTAMIEGRRRPDGRYEARCRELYGDNTGIGQTPEEATENLKTFPFVP